MFFPVDILTLCQLTTMRGAGYLQLLAAAHLLMLAVADEVDATITVFTTTDVVATVTVSEYIYTNCAGSLTTDFVTGATTVPGTSYSTTTSSGSASSSASVAISPSAVTPVPTSGFTLDISVPAGVYSRSTSTTTTVVDGATAVVEFLVLYTNTC